MENVLILGNWMKLDPQRDLYSRSKFKSYVLGGWPAGGQLTTTSEVENFPGFPPSVDGFELMNNLLANRPQNLRASCRKCIY